MTTTVAIAFMFALALMAGVTTFALHHTFKLRLVMSQHMKDIAQVQDRALGVDVHQPLTIPRRKISIANDMDVQKAKDDYAAMIDRGYMTERDEQRFKVAGDAQ